MSSIQWTVLAFFAAVWAALALILRAAPDIYGLAAAEVSPLSFFVAISLVIAFGMIGTVRRWRWVFWLILVAFLAGALRIVVSALELAGAVPLDGPRWYVTTQGLIGLVQLVIGIAMVRSYRRAGVWGATGP
ncbi:MAG TPA: hypothetical protein VL333_07705 [Candidatus Saccharimonadales bacterium]|nr:hypothetical protein [Candidatus Saccharimonadales bacterium]